LEIDREERVVFVSLAIRATGKTQQVSFQTKLLKPDLLLCMVSMKAW